MSDRISRSAYSALPMSTPKTGDRPWNEGGAEDLCRLYVQLPASSAEAYFRALQTRFGEAAEKLAQVTCSASSAFENRQNAFGYVDMFVQSISRNFADKVQPIPVMSDSTVIYAFGQNPMTVRVNGALLNTKENDQAVAFEILYQTVLRATRLAESRSKCFFFMPDRTMQGVILDTSMDQSAPEESIVSFGFTFLVQKIMVTLNENWKPHDLAQTRSKYEEDFLNRVTLTPLVTPQPFVTGANANDIVGDSILPINLV